MCIRDRNTCVRRSALWTDLRPYLSALGPARDCTRTSTGQEFKFDYASLTFEKLCHSPQLMRLSDTHGASAVTSHEEESAGVVPGSHAPLTGMQVALAG
eukprot:6345746-Prymnesium_polylepis.2